MLTKNEYIDVTIRVRDISRTYHISKGAWDQNGSEYVKDKINDLIDYQKPTHADHLAGLNAKKLKETILLLDKQNINWSNWLDEEIKE